MKPSVADPYPALAMGVDPPIGDLIVRKQQAVRDQLIHAHLWASVVQTGVVIALLTLLTMDFQLPGGLIAGAGDQTTERTAGCTVPLFTSLSATAYAACSQCVPPCSCRGAVHS